MKKITLAALSGLTALLSGCIATPGGLAPSSIPITANDSYTIVRRNVESSSTGVSLFGAIPLGPGPSAYRALMAAKEDNHADGLINVTAENRHYYYLLLITYDKIVVSGDAIKFQIGGEDVE
ncbi:MAG: hypothetical protein PHQ27_06735 [Victivallales bacterium]|nr:hypothetical protein [Victivallales bacterium]